MKWWADISPWEFWQLLRNGWSVAKGNVNTTYVATSEFWIHLQAALLCDLTHCGRVVHVWLCGCHHWVGWNGDKTYKNRDGFWSIRSIWTNSREFQNRNNFFHRIAMEHIVCGNLWSCFLFANLVFSIGGLTWARWCGVGGDDDEAYTCQHMWMVSTI